MKRTLLFVLLAMLALCVTAPGFVAAESDIFHYAISMDESTMIDRLLYEAMRRTGYSMTMDSAPMGYAIQMANSGESDGLASQAAGIEANFPNLVMVPEQLSSVSFPAFAMEDSDIEINSWADYSGLRVGCLYQKTYIMNHLPKDVAEIVQKESFYELNMALLAGECDVIVTSETSGVDLIVAGGIKKVGVLDNIPSFTYLNKDHEDMLSDVAGNLKAMKEDGSYDAIVSGDYYSSGRQKEVLHISSYYPDDPWDGALKEGVDSVLSGHEDISYYNIPLYSNRFHSEYERAQNAYHSVRTMFLSSPPDVILISDVNALKFVCDYYGVFFRGVPVVFCGINDDVEYIWELGGNYTGVYENIAAMETVEEAISLFPGAESVFVINDYTSRGTAWREDVKAQLEPMEEIIDIEYNENLTLNTLLNQIAALPSDTVLLLGDYSVDGEGLYYNQSEIVKRITARTSAPLFGLMGGMEGLGQFGGKYVDPKDQGALGAALALRVLGGEQAAEIEPLRDTSAFNEWIFDESEMDALAIGKADLPEGTVLVNHTPTLKEANPEAYYFMMGVLVLAVAIIAILAFSVAAVRKKNARLVAMQRDLNTADEASRAKSLFLSNMSHEIRTPMNAVIGMLKIASSSDDIGKIQNCIATARASSGHLLNIINDILDFSKIESGKLELVSEHFNLDAIIHSIMSVISVRTAEKNQQLIINIADDVPKELVGDPTRLTQVIINLLSNAVKFSGEGSKIRFSAGLKGMEGDCARIQFSVEDEGIGISAEQQEKLFQSFQQADSSITKRFGGTGLGLAISKRIVEMMGGGINVTSVLGEGSAFTFDVLLKAAQKAETEVGAKAAATEVDRESIPKYPGKRIMLVEDIAVNREIVKLLLEESEVEITEAGNGREAVDLFCESPGKFDLILMDVQMPVMDGYAATGAIRSCGKPNSETVPIVAMTANAFDEDVKRALGAGMNGHIAKPVDEYKMFDELDKHLKDGDAPL